MSQQKNSRDIDIEWENRVLCSDGNCIGVIGPDGRCKECGLKLEEGEEDGALETREYDDDDTDDNITDALDDNKAEKVADAEWENRVLCSDEGCIGVIGPDGRCKECGKPLT